MLIIESSASSLTSAILDGADQWNDCPGTSEASPAGLRHLLSNRRTVCADGREVEIHPLDLTYNALDRRARRDKPSKASIQPTTPASEAFDEDFGPIVDADGNYYDPEEET